MHGEPHIRRRNTFDDGPHCGLKCAECDFLGDVNVPAAEGRGEQAKCASYKGQSRSWLEPAGTVPWELHRI